MSGNFAIHRADGSGKHYIMTARLRSSLLLAALALMALALAGCGKVERYRYKLTLAVNTPEGIRRGSSVVEVTFWEVSLPARGVANQLRGEALYVDLGPG